MQDTVLLLPLWMKSMYCWWWPLELSSGQKKPFLSPPLTSVLVVGSPAMGLPV